MGLPRDHFLVQHCLTYKYIINDLFGDIPSLWRKHVADAKISIATKNKEYSSAIQSNTDSLVKIQRDPSGTKHVLCLQ